MKIGILYICTGKYDVFWKDFYESAEKFLLMDSEKHYFVFTDSKKISSTDRVHIIYQERLGWPNDTLMRFHMFLKIESDLLYMDYLYFFNANYLFIKPILIDELLPDKETHLIGVVFPGYYHIHKKKLTFEPNVQSTAYISPNVLDTFYAGGFYGGKTAQFLKLSKTLAKNIDQDFLINYVAIDHDNSHINKYFSIHKPKSLHPGYCYPEGWIMPFKQKTLLRDKSLLGGHEYIRGDSMDIKKINYYKLIMFKLKMYVRSKLFLIFGFSPI